MTTPTPRTDELKKALWQLMQAQESERAYAWRDAIHCGIEQLERDLAAAQEARQRAEALAEEYKKDAERYRYLRSRDKDEVFNNDGVKAGVWIDCTAEDGTLQLLTFEDADAAIDAVFAGEPK